MQEFRFYFLTTMTYVTMVLSIEVVLDNTAKKQDWTWIIKESKLSFEALGVSRKAER